MHLPSTRKPRISHHFNSGANHVRYDHRQRPTCIEIACPRCAGRAVASGADHAEGRRVIGDASPGWDAADFSVTCTACMHRAKGLCYAELGAPLHQVSIAGRTLWAWNEEHLRMILKTLRGESLKGDSYAFFATYIRRGWMQWRARFITAIERHLESQAAARPRRA